jgi:hypothetical protein
LSYKQQWVSNVVRAENVTNTTNRAVAAQARAAWLAEDRGRVRECPHAIADARRYESRAAAVQARNEMIAKNTTDMFYLEGTSLRQFTFEYVEN